MVKKLWRWTCISEYTTKLFASGGMEKLFFHTETVRDHSIG